MKKSEVDPMAKFWVDTFISDTVVDWDVFVNAFCLFVDKHYRVRLQQLQRNEVKRIVDPANNQEIKVSNFNNFIEDYWILPINRQKLFKKHFKASDTDYQNGLKHIQIKITAQQQNKERQLNYIFKNDSLRQGNMSHPLKNKGFVNIGSSELSDITINNMYLNPMHLKIFKHPLGYKFKDISKSNRVMISVTQPLLLRTGMVIKLFNYDLIITSVLNNPIDHTDDFIDIQFNPEATLNVINDSTLSFIIKDTRNQEQKKYCINYKKIFKIGKNPQNDAVLYDLASDLLAGQLAYYRDNWFIEPKQPIAVYMANRQQIQNGLNSASMFLPKDFKLLFKGVSVQLKAIRN